MMKIFGEMRLPFRVHSENNLETPKEVVLPEKIEVDPLEMPTFCGNDPILVEYTKPPELQLPQFIPPSQPKAKYLTNKKITKPCLHLQYHPLVKNIDRLSSTYHLLEIRQLAVERDALSDVKVINGHSQLKIRYLKALFEHMIREAPWLIPQSATFSTSPEHDQEQINLWTGFCRDLCVVEEWRSIPLYPNRMIPNFISLLRSQPTFGQSKLLEFKEAAFCYLSEMLAQELRAAQRFGTTKKELSEFKEAIVLLSNAIQSQILAYKMATVREVSKLDFSNWEDRETTKPFVVSLDLPLVREYRLSFEDNLSAIQGETVTTWQIKDYTERVLLLPESTLPEVTLKAGYFLELARVYLRLPTTAALQRAISWIDRAIVCLESQGANQDHQRLLECYECRGAVRQKMAQRLKVVSSNDTTLARQRLDSSYRDFHYSSGLQDGKENNLVRRARAARERSDLSGAVAELEEIAVTDSDYSEAHYLGFLKQYERLRCDSARLLHPQFARLRGIPLEGLVEAFKLTLLSASQKHASLFKITHSSGTAYLKCTSEAVWLDRSSSEFLIELLTQGVKKAEAIRSPEFEIYFFAHITQKELYELIQKLGDPWKRLEEFEQEIRVFHRFEIAGFYKLTLLEAKEELFSTTVLLGLDTDLMLRYVELHLYAMRAYLQWAAIGHTGKKEVYAAALLHVCHALRGYEFLLKQKPDESLKKKKFELLIQKALIYKRMGLLSCYVEDLEAVLALSKRENPRYVNPQIHYALSLAYLKLGDLEAAQEHRNIVSHLSQGRSAKKIKGLDNKLEKQFFGFENKALNAVDEAQLLAEFQDQNIREECLQLLNDHEQANSYLHPTRFAPLWQAFLEKIDQTTTLKEFCEQLFACVLIDKKVSAERLLKIALLSQIELKEPCHLDEIKNYIKDALADHLEIKRQLEDKSIAEHQHAKAEVARIQAYYAFKTDLIQDLKQGKLLRPGSVTRDKLQDLAALLNLEVKIDQEYLMRSLEAITGKTISHDWELPHDEMELVKQEIAEILENALEIEIPPPQPKNGVLQVFGNNIFLSHVKETVKKSLSQVTDVHLMGVHVYIDTSIHWPGINLAIGGDYVEFMVDKGPSGRAADQQLVLDLSGATGKNGSAPPNKAANGPNPCDSGANGIAGVDGEGGQPGGDFYLEAKSQLIGFSPDIIQQINLSGAEGGCGGDGQDGGDGAKGVAGTPARTEVNDGDPADCWWHGYIDHRRGGKGRPGGWGGEGGRAGLGGLGGLSGCILVEKEKTDPIQQQIITGNGKVGADGHPGAGGKGGAGEPDALDYLLVKGGITDGRDEFHMMEPYIHDSSKDRSKKGWRDGTTPEATQTRNQEQSRGRGKTAEEQTRQRKSKEKQALKRELFNSNLNQHLHLESPGNKAGAFEEVTNRLAVAHETEEILREQLAIQQKRIREIETLQQTTATLLHQTQTKQSAKIEHTRIAAFTPKRREIDLIKEVKACFLLAELDEKNKLPFQKCSPIFDQKGPLVIHPVEIAMQEVNLTQGRYMPALATLFIALNQLEAPNFDCEKRGELLQRLAEIVRTAALKDAYQDFDQVLVAARRLKEAPDFISVVKSKGIKVKAFNAAVEREKEAIDRVCQTRIDALVLQIGVQHFICKDRLIRKIEAGKYLLAEKDKKWRWFQARLYKKVELYLRQLQKKKLSKTSVDYAVVEHLVEQANQVLKTIQEQLKNGPQQLPFLKALTAHRKQLKQQLKSTREAQQWILDRLPELVEARILPNDSLKKEPLEAFYLACSQRWSTCKQQEEKIAENQPTLPLDSLSPQAKWIAQKREAKWDEAKMAKLESHLKRLSDIKGEYWEEQSAYFEYLNALYQRPDYESLADVFLACAQVCPNNLKFSQHVISKLATDDADYFFKIKDQYAKTSSQLSQAIHHYLNGRYLFFAKQKCLKQFEELVPSTKFIEEKKRKVNELVDTLLLEANAFYGRELFLPRVDFTQVCIKVILAHAPQINALLDPSLAQSKSSSVQAGQGVEFRTLMLKQAVADQLASRDLDNHEELILGLAHEKDLHTIRALLFWLANQTLSYAQLQRLNAILKACVLEEPFKQEALAYFRQWAEILKIAFSERWKGGLEKGKLYDQLRRHYIKEDPESIETLLYQIAEEADFLTSDEKIEILDKTIAILTNQGCLTCITKLKALHTKNAARIGLFPITQAETNPNLTVYNDAIGAAFSSSEKPDTSQLTDLFLRCVEDSEFQTRFFVPSIIALNHLYFAPPQLMVLYRKIEQYQQADSKTLKSHCVQTIRSRLTTAFEERIEAYSKVKADREASLNQEKASALAKISEGLTSSQILYPERQVAKFELWLRKLDVHFEVESPGDHRGKKRLKLYSQALERFYQALNAQDIQKGLEGFNTWLRDVFNRELKKKEATTELLTALLDQLESPTEDERIRATQQIKSLYWLGVLPYNSDSKSVQTLVSLIEDWNFDEKQAKKQAKLLKLVFDEAMVQEACYQEKEKLATGRQTREEQLTLWITGITQQLLSASLQSEELEKIYPQDTILEKAVSGRAVPDTVAVEQPTDDFLERELTLDQWIQLLSQKIADPSFETLFKKASMKIMFYLNDLYQRIEDKLILPQDRARLRGLKQPIQVANWKELSSFCSKVELKLIDFEDSQNDSKRLLIDRLLKSYKKLLPSDPNDLNAKQITKDIEQLNNTLCCCAALMHRESFLRILDALNNYLEKQQEPLNLKSLSHLFWALPRLKQPELFLEVVETKLPDHWALALLEKQCEEAFDQALTQELQELPPLNLTDLRDAQKEEQIDKALRLKKEECQRYSQSFKQALKQLVSTSQLNLRSRELLMRLIADRLALLNQGKLSFSLSAFTHLLNDYLVSEPVLRHLSQELLREDSLISNLLFQNSFESFRYGLTLSWIQSSLGSSLKYLSREGAQQLFDSLFEIETLKKEEAMRQVVASLKGGLINESVVECVANFAQGSWELDETTLRLLSERASKTNWYSEIAEYTQKKRAQNRDLATLVRIMAQEGEGINRSIQHLLIGEKPRLVSDIEDIKQKFKSIEGWSAAQLTEWAEKVKSESFSEDPERLKMAIAMVSLGYKLTERHTLRDVQLIALWLTVLREGGQKHGRIRQVFTGEGKSIIFTGLAIIRGLSKSYCDIITTSFLLAERDAISKKPLFDLFNLTVSNNCDTACDSDEEVRKDRYFVNQRPVDIIYGDVAAFERDLLLTEFHNKEIIPKERLTANRSALVDEVDGLFLDNASMVLYLSHNVDTLRFIERIFAQIWILANHPSFAQAQPHDDQAVGALVESIKNKIETDEIFLPAYKIANATFMEMKAIIARKLPIWVRSALFAKVINVNNEYIITDQATGSGKKKKAVTVMDKGTGVEQFSLKWSNGLHQFLQLKHGLELTAESLKAVFLSNYFFFKQYGPHLYGLSGTLGSDAEQKYLQDLYQIDLCKIPRYKGEKYVQYKPTVAGSREEWLEAIEKSVQRQIQELKRAVLIICESVEDTLIVQEALKDKYPSIQIYTSSLQDLAFVSNERQTPVAPGDLLAATNLAGRGTDLKTTALLEAHGGLHVILSYLPSNIRIQEQAFGRTARSGNEGSGEFIILDPARRSLTELCRFRDLEEKRRLESVAIKEIKKIEFEQELLRGFRYKGEEIAGFQSLLDLIKNSLAGEEEFYREAQLNSLKNRWAFWLDHMDEKISLVHAIGKETVLVSFREFHQGVWEDFQAGGLRLIKEPIELIKLGSEYRRKEKWSEAEQCYAEAANDPHYHYVRYYRAACQLIKSPTSDRSATKKFKKEAKKAAQAIKPEITQIQSALSQIISIAEQRRRETGQADLGNPYKARSEERVQIWSIFLSAIDSAIGGSLSADVLTKSNYVKSESQANAILKQLGRFRESKIKNGVRVEGDKVLFGGKTLNLPENYLPVLRELAGKKDVNKQALTAHCAQLMTQEKAKTYFTVSPYTFWKLLPLPNEFKKWPEGGVYTHGNQFVLSSIVLELKGEKFESEEALKKKLEEKKGAYDSLSALDVNGFYDLLVAEKLAVEEQDFKIDLRPLIDAEARFSKFKEVKKGFNSQFQELPKKLRHALVRASAYKQNDESGSQWKINSSISLSELSLPKSTQEAADALWSIFEEQHLIKHSKVKLAYGDYKAQCEEVEQQLKNFFANDPEKEEAVKDVFKIIESSFGMVYKLEDKKKTAEFAAIIRKFFHDHGQAAPEGLNFFIELGLEVIADLIEKKDPPAWFEVVAVTAMGLTQMVAGAIIKAYLPVVGELIGNALISTGMDDIMFGINSAIKGEFSWGDYAAAKGESLKRSLISSAINCGVNFGVSSIKNGLGNAWQAQQLTEAAKAGSSFNIGSFVLKEVGRSFLNTGISQLSSRGFQGMIQVISGSYEKELEEGIKKGVNAQWSLVKTQAQEFFDKAKCDQVILANLERCVSQSLEKIQESGFFDGVIRASRQILPHVSSEVGSEGWEKFINHCVPALAQLGVSLPKLVNLVEDNMRDLARRIRATKERIVVDDLKGPSVTLDQLKSHLDQLKKQCIKQLIDSFKGILNSAVYAPIVSWGTQELIEKSNDWIFSSKEEKNEPQAKKSASEELDPKELLERAKNERAFKEWKEANDEVTSPAAEELEQKPVNSEMSVGTLIQQYGNLVKIYRDQNGQLHADIPTRSEYIQGVLDGKINADPSFLILLKSVINEKMGGANRGPAGVANEMQFEDFLENACQNTPFNREQIMSTLGADESLKRYYHNLELGQIASPVAEVPSINTSSANTEWNERPEVAIANEIASDMAFGQLGSMGMDTLKGLLAEMRAKGVEIAVDRAVEDVAQGASWREVRQRAFSMAKNHRTFEKYAPPAVQAILLARDFVTNTMESNCQNATFETAKSLIPLLVPPATKYALKAAGVAATTAAAVGAGVGFAISVVGGVLYSPTLASGLLEREPPSLPFNSFNPTVQGRFNRAPPPLESFIDRFQSQVAEDPPYPTIRPAR